MASVHLEPLEPMKQNVTVIRDLQETNVNVSILECSLHRFAKIW